MIDFTIKNDRDKSFSISKVEFWAATIIFVFALVSLPTGESPREFLFGQAFVPFSYYGHYVIPQLLRYSLFYVVFLSLNFWVVPRLIRKEALALNIIIVILIFFGLGSLLGTLDTYTKNYIFNEYGSDQAAYELFFQRSFHYAFWLLLMFALYSVIKYTALYILSNSEAIQSKYRIVTRDGLTVFILWMVSMFLLLISEAEKALIVAWGIFGPYAILLYGYSFYELLPKVISKARPLRAYLLRIFLILVVSFIPIALIFFLLLQEDRLGFGISALNILFQLLVTVPFSWVMFKRHIRGREELFTLRNELGRSTANLDFLRSQINPHFLFNALNTIYGTAIQEKAERTSEGIEKLGDMMRFMLQENMQEKISLVREIDYLNNYISLQKLRTDPNPNIRVQAIIECPTNSIQIAPMLLIPFVENAFKHGISFREPSHINITLEVKNNILNFDVYNSKHSRQENDPEKDNNGIGLENVKQRLQLVYPGKHDLQIRKTGKEFFIHLTIFNLG